MTWDNGDRTVLVNPNLGGMTLGWNLLHTSQDELFAAIEGTAFHTRVILERMEEHGVPVRRIINGGGIPQKNAVLNQVYANVMGKPILVPKGDVTSLGSAIFAFLVAGTFKTIDEALCLGGKELAVAVMDGKALGVTDIQPKSGAFDQGDQSRLLRHILLAREVLKLLHRVPERLHVRGVRLLLLADRRSSSLISNRKENSHYFLESSASTSAASSPLGSPPQSATKGRSVPVPHGRSRTG